jgi:glutaryl-CoA dehydrogenase
MGAIFDAGTPAQRAHYLPSMAAGKTIGCFGLTEAHGGSDPANLKTTATRADGRWRLNGAKQWITNGGIADVAVVWAQTREGVAGFLVERGTPGFEQRTTKGKFSLRASNTGELFFDDVLLDDEQRLAHGEGLKSALRCLDEARFGICWGAVGAAQSCLEEVVSFVRDRQLFGSTLARKQMIQARLADCTRQLAGAQLAANRLGALKLTGRARPAHVSLVKWNNVRAALDIARTCRDILGAAGITTDYRSMRHMLNLESVVTYEGTESIHTLVVGRAITGESAF